MEIFSNKYQCLYIVCYLIVDVSKYNNTSSSNNNKEVIQVFHIIQTSKTIINKTLMNQLTEHLTKQKITSTDQ